MARQQSSHCAFGGGPGAGGLRRTGHRAFAAKPAADGGAAEAPKARNPPACRTAMSRRPRCSRSPTRRCGTAGPAWARLGRLADTKDPERVIMRNPANGKFVIGALFRRERENPGPALQISSDAAAALGILAGAPAKISVTALRREEAPEETPETPILDSAEAVGDAPPPRCRGGRRGRDQAAGRPAPNPEKPAKPGSNPRHRRHRQRRGWMRRHRDLPPHRAKPAAARRPAPAPAPQRPRAAGRRSRSASSRSRPMPNARSRRWQSWRPPEVRRSRATARPSGRSSPAATRRC